jgi:hypothetical protein
VSFDFVPLATALQTGDLKSADQLTRDALVVLSGAKAKNRDFAYFSEIKDIPKVDMGTMERLWLAHSGGRLGFSVQRRLWRSRGVGLDFELFCKKVGWTVVEGETVRKRRWFGESEFCYELGECKEGHLPLTSALRGTAVLKKLMEHPVWEDESWREEPGE